MAYYRYGPTAVGNRTSWGPVSSPTSVDPKTFDRPLSGNYDRIFNAFDKTNAFEYIRSSFESGKEEERSIGHEDVVVRRRLSSSFERASDALAAAGGAAIEDVDDDCRRRMLCSQARQLYPLQEDLADWINTTIGVDNITGDNFLEALDNGASLYRLAAVVQQKTKEAIDQGLREGPVPELPGRCWRHAARRSFFSRDNADNFLAFCRALGVHQNLLFESDDLVLHNNPRQVVLCLLELGRLGARVGMSPPGLVQLERELAAEELAEEEQQHVSWQFRDRSPRESTSPPPMCTPENKPKEKKAPGLVDRTTPSPQEIDVPFSPTTELDKRVQQVSRMVGGACRCGTSCSRLLRVRKLGEGRYCVGGRRVLLRLLRGRHMMVRVGGGWDTLEHFLARHEPCQVRLLARAAPDSRDLTRDIARELTPASSRDSVASPSSDSSGGKASPAPVSRRSLTLPLRPIGAISPQPPPVTISKSRSANFAAEKGRRSSEGKRPVPAETKTSLARKARSQSLASSPAEPRKPFCGTDRLNEMAKKSRPVSTSGPLGSLSVAVTREDIEEGVRRSLATAALGPAPFLHIKAKYRSPPPREAPPR